MVGWREKVERREGPPEGWCDDASRRGFRFSLRIVEDERQSTRHDDLSSQIVAAAADGLHGILMPAKSAAVIELHGMSGCEVPAAAWCATTCPARREDCLHIGDLWSVGRGEGEVGFV